MHKVLLKKQGQCGKITYMDPLVFENQDFDGFSVDMWACGIILFILLAGVPPLELPSLIDPRFKMIAAGRLDVLLDTWQLGLSKDARDLLGRLLNVNPEERATIEEVRGHRWMMG
jgi:serine/threonine protein kinase